MTVRAKDDDGQTATATKTVEITRKPGGGGGVAVTAGRRHKPPDGLDLGGQAELKAVLSKGFVLRASCSEHCTLSIQLVADKATAKKLKLGKKPTVIGKLTRALDGSAKLKVKLTGKAKQALKTRDSVKLSRARGGHGRGRQRHAPLTKRVTLKR